MRGSAVNFALISCRNNPSPRWVSVPSFTLEAAPSISVTTLSQTIEAFLNQRHTAARFDGCADNNHRTVKGSAA